MTQEAHEHVQDLQTRLLQDGIAQDRYGCVLIAMCLHWPVSPSTPTSGREKLLRLHCHALVLRNVEANGDSYIDTNMSARVSSMLGCPEPGQCGNGGAICNVAVTAVGAGKLSSMDVRLMYW